MFYVKQFLTLAPLPELVCQNEGLLVPHSAVLLAETYPVPAASLLKLGVKINPSNSSPGTAHADSLVGMRSATLFSQLSAHAILPPASPGAGACPPPPRCLRDL